MFTFLSSIFYATISSKWKKEEWGLCLLLMFWSSYVLAQEKKNTDATWVAPLSLEQLRVSAADQRWFAAQKKKIREALIPELTYEETLNVQADILSTRLRKKKNEQENE